MNPSLAFLLPPGKIRKAQRRSFHENSGVQKCAPFVASRAAKLQTSNWNEVATKEVCIILSRPSEKSGA